MKKPLILQLILICLCSPLFAQTPFQKSLPVYLDTALIRSSPDGQSVYVVGSSKSNANRLTYVMRLDNGGNLLWQREYSGSATTSAKSIETVQDGLLVLMGDKPNDTRANGFLMKFKPDGTVAWSRQVGAKNLTNVLEIKKDGAENIWLCAEHLKAFATDSVYSFLAQFDGDGRMLSNRKNVSRFLFTVQDEVYRATDLVWNPRTSALIMVQDFEAPYAVSYISGPNRGRYTLRNEINGRSEDWFMSLQIHKMVMTKENIAASGWTLAVGDLRKDIPAICLLNSRGRDLMHLKTTKNVQQPIHSQSGDIVFYDPIDKILSKYDTSLTAIWTKKYDNCYETKNFAADVAVDGSIYSIRNISDKTVINHILPTGSLSVCADYTKPPVPIFEFDNFFTLNNSFNVSGLYALPFQAVDSTLIFNTTNPSTLDNCFRLDAAFNLPDTVCLGTSLKPENVDTTTGLIHEWFILSQWNQNVQPKIDFPAVGRYRVFHSLKNIFCTDTISRYVSVVLPPKITLSDTIVCGSAKITVNLTDNNASRYFLNGTATPPIFDIKQSGNYMLRAENPSCRADKTVKIKIVDFPSPLKPVDSLYCAGVPVPVVLTGRFENIFWDNKPIVDTFIIKDATKHSYRATYSLDKDCIVKGDFSILRKSCGSVSVSIPDIVYVPTAFTPNGDGANEVFQAYPSKDAEVLSMMIYNRWGNLVFQSINGTDGWNGLVNGKIVSPDVFVYWLTYRDKRTDKVGVLSGNVMLVK
jgi:gliding motility-associated-like protein